MDSCEGVLLIPPERGQLLGRALWKVSGLLGPLNSFRPVHEATQPDSTPAFFFSFEEASREELLSIFC